MSIVAWEAAPPPDKAEWIAVLREVLAGERVNIHVNLVGRGRPMDATWKPATS